DPYQRKMPFFNLKESLELFKDYVDFSQAEFYGPEIEKEYSAEGINRLIALGREHGFIVCWNHPTWSMEDASVYTHLKGLFAMEIFNTGARVTGYDITNTLLPLSVSSTQRMGGETETERVEIVTSVTGEVAVVRPVGDQGDTTGMVSAQRAARIVDRKTGTPPMMLSDATEEEIEELFDMFEYDTPLWGGLLNTGDIAPAWPFAFAFLGALALAAFLLTGRRRRSR
ncbi:MAG: hypothetical protein IKN05_02390, partial [Clostridia bacterium]|nr:hypothetical protein [Clostridia bacterium]